MTKSKFFFIYTLVVFYSLFASHRAIADRESLLELSNHPVWLKVLHYSKRGASEILDSEFFLSEQGSKNSIEELIATIEAFEAPVKDDVNKHALCRFPARRILIEKYLNRQFEALECTQYHEWLGELNSDSVSLLFATGYFENPASFYGHILLKFNRPGTESGVDLMSSSVNFGALDTESDSLLFYIFKGLLGGYKSAFSDQLFYRHNLSYGETQLRDIWEYRLALSDEQLNLIRAHLWELLPVKFKYYFLKQNCAYRMAELVELVIDQELISKSYPFAIPYSVFDNLSNKASDSEYVESIHYIPSLQGRMSTKLNQLNNRQKKLVRLLISSDFNIENSEYSALDIEEKAQVLEVLLDYFQFLSAKKENPDYKLTVKNAIHLERLKLDASLVEWKQKTDLPPHNGVRPSMLRFSASSSKAFDSKSLRFRPAYYDFLTPEYARLPNSKLIALEIGLEYADDEFRIEKLDLLDIHTLSLSQSGLPGDGGMAWKFYTGYKDLFIGCKDCKTPLLEVGVGYGFKYEGVTLFAMLNGRSHKDYFNVGSISGQAEAGIFLDIHKSASLYLSALKNHYEFDSAIEKYKYRAELRLFDSKAFDVRFLYEKELQEKFEVMTSYYF